LYLLNAISRYLLGALLPLACVTNDIDENDIAEMQAESANCHPPFKVTPSP
jgi:hypothetical protein